MTRDELRKAWIERLRLHGGEIIDPVDVAHELFPAISPHDQRTRKWSVKNLMGLVDLQGHERGEPLGQSLADLYELKGYTAAQIADELESGRYWAEWTEEDGR